MVRKSDFFLLWVFRFVGSVGLHVPGHSALLLDSVVTL